MQRQHIPMSVAEYEAMPKPFGYKVEYWGSEAVFTPRDCSVDCLLAITSTMPELCFPALVPVTTMQVVFVDAFFAAFNDTVEFCDWQEDAIWVHAEKFIAGYFTGKRGKPHPLSRIVLGSAGKVQACALLVENADGLPKLDVLFVDPSQQRQGIARMLMGTIINQLYHQGVTQLFSAYHICNQPSRAWHENMGFDAIPQGCYAQLNYAWHRDEYHRLRMLHPDQDCLELQATMAYWREMAEAWRHSLE